MKRRKLSKSHDGRKGKHEADEAVPREIQYSGLSLVDIPRQVLVDILLRLPVKIIIICKCVCKTLNEIISDAEFAKLHFAQEEVYPIMRKLDSTRLSRVLYLVQLEQDQDFLGRFSCQKCRGLFDPRCGCLVDIKLNSKLKLPIRNFELVPNDNGDANAMLNCKFETKRKRYISLRPKIHKYKMVNSCNGLLCLSEQSDNDPVVVCNPVTGEFINLPKAKKAIDSYSYSDCGLGFSPVTNQYKVVRIFREPWPITRDSKLTYHGRVAEVNTLGTGSWRDIGYAPRSKYRLAFPTHLNGALHWFYIDESKSQFIVSFNIDKERFRFFPSPPWSSRRHPSICRYSRQHMSMGVLEGCLCICDSSRLNLITVWMMKDYGVKKSWTQAFSVCGDYFDSVRKGLYLPIKLLNDGALLLYHYSDSALIYFKSRELVVRYFKVKGVKISFEVTAHTPSIISLKDVLAGGNVEVLSICSRCADLKLDGEARAISLIEDIWDLDTQSDSSYDRRRLDEHLWWY